jgi:hypothetical protein
MGEEIFRVDKFVVPAHAREGSSRKFTRHTRFSEPGLVLCGTPSWNKRLVLVNSTS